MKNSLVILLISLCYWGNAQHSSTIVEIKDFGVLMNRINSEKTDYIYFYQYDKVKLTDSLEEYSLTYVDSISIDAANNSEKFLAENISGLNIKYFEIIPYSTNSELPTNKPIYGITYMGSYFEYMGYLSHIVKGEVHTGHFRILYEFYITMIKYDGKWNNKR